MDFELLGYSGSIKRPLLNQQLASSICQYLPERMQLRPQWKLKYSLERDGASIKTLYSNALPSHGDRPQRGYILAIRDGKNGLFGAYVNEPLKPSDGRYRGNGDCFLWKLGEQNQVVVFNYSGTNDFMLFCTPHFISFGGGDGHYGLWVDDSLEKGVSYPSLTYVNEVLSLQGSKFTVIGLELWEI